MNINMATRKCLQAGASIPGGGAISHIFKSGGLKAWLFQLGKGKGKCIYIAHFL